MTERAQRIVNATMELTLRPKSGNRERVIANEVEHQDAN
jgi:hypothetical protein